MHRYGAAGEKSGYEIPRLTEEEYETLRWLSARGYDGGILDIAGVEEEHEDGGATLGAIPEHKAWEVQQAVEEDPGAFLTSSGSRSLNRKLQKFLDSIV